MKFGMRISQKIQEIRLALRALPLPHVFLCLFVPLGIGSFLACSIIGLESTSLAAAIVAVGTLLEYVQRIKS